MSRLIQSFSLGIVALLVLDWSISLIADNAIALADQSEPSGSNQSTSGFKIESFLQMETISEAEVDELFPDLPPHPGEEAKQTVGGVDADQDGVRDDIQRWVYRVYPESETLRLALFQLASDKQNSLIEANESGTGYVIESTRCLSSMFGPSERGEYYRVRSDLNFLMTDTKARVLADIAATANFRSQIYGKIDFDEDHKQYCRFRDPSDSPSLDASTSNLSGNEDQKGRRNVDEAQEANDLEETYDIDPEFEARQRVNVGIDADGDGLRDSLRRWILNNYPPFLQEDYVYRTKTISEAEVDKLFPDLPPNPGEVGKQTVAGVDLDQDGVRDDVQRWIYRAYPDSDQKRLALLQYASDVQDSLTHVADREISSSKTRRVLNSMGCVRGTVGWDDYFTVIEELSYIIINTKDRILADVAGSVNFSGQVYSSGLELGDDPRRFCRFEREDKPLEE